MNMIHSLNSLELSKLGQIRKQAATRHISSLRDTTILAMSNMLTANIDSGLTHAIGETAPHVLIIIAYQSTSLLPHYLTMSMCITLYCTCLEGELLLAIC